MRLATIMRKLIFIGLLTDVSIQYKYAIEKNISLRFSNNSEAFASEFLVNLEELLYRYY